MFSVSEFLNSSDANGEWTVVAGKSTVTFDIKTMWGLSTVRGRFREFSGHGQVTDAGEVSGEIDIDADSLDTGSRMRDRHLRSTDFFKVDRFPQIKVVVTSAEPASGDTLNLETFFTVTGTTKPFSLPAVVSRRDDGTVTLSAEQTIDRRDLGVRWNKLRVVGNDTTVRADLVFRRGEG